VFCTHAYLELWYFFPLQHMHIDNPKSLKIQNLWQSKIVDNPKWFDFDSHILPFNLKLKKHGVSKCQAYIKGIWKYVFLGSCLIYTEANWILDLHSNLNYSKLDYSYSCLVDFWSWTNYCFSYHGKGSHFYKDESPKVQILFALWVI